MAATGGSSEVPHWSGNLFDRLSVYSQTDQFVYILGVLLAINFITTFIQLIGWFLSPRTLVTRLVCVLFGFSLWQSYFKEKHDFILKAGNDCSYGTLFYQFITLKGLNCPEKSTEQKVGEFNSQFNPIDFLFDSLADRVAHPITKISTLLSESYNKLVGSTWFGSVVAYLTSPIVSVGFFFLALIIVWKLSVFACRWWWNSSKAQPAAWTTTGSTRPKVKVQKTKQKNGTTHSVGSMVGGVASSLTQFGMNAFSSSSLVLSVIKSFNLILPWYIQWVVVAVCLFVAFMLSTFTWFAKYFAEVIDADLGLNEQQVEDEVEEPANPTNNNKLTEEKLENNVTVKGPASTSLTESTSDKSIQNGPMYHSCTFNIVINRSGYASSELSTWNRTKLRNRRSKAKPYDKLDKVSPEKKNKKKFETKEKDHSE